MSGPHENEHERLERLADEESSVPSPVACPNCDETGVLHDEWFKCHHCGYEEDRA